MRRIVWIALGWLALSLSVQAASFDCSKAQTKVEHIICDTPEISRLDDELGAAYKDAMKNKKYAALVKEHHKRLLEPRNECVNTDCVLQYYNVALPFLTAFGQRTASGDARKPSVEKIYKYDFYKAQSKYGDEDSEGEPSSEVLAARPFCEAIITALNNTNPREDYRPCISEELLKLPGVSNPPWEKLDISQHEELAKIIMTLSNAGTDEYFREKKFYPQMYPSPEQQQRGLERVKELGAEMFALKLAPELFGDRVMVTLRYKDEMCGRPLKLPPQPRGERADVAWVTADFKGLATGSMSFDPKAARPLLYQGALYFVEPTADGVYVYVPTHEWQTEVCNIDISIKKN